MFKNIIYILSLIIILLLVFNYTNRIKPIIKTKVEYISKTDTIFKNTIDTIYDTIRVQLTEIQYDTLYIKNDSLKEYVYNIDTTNLRGEFRVNTSGKIYNTLFNYTLNIPHIIEHDTILIHKRDSIIVTNNIYKNKIRLFLGASIGFKNTINKIGVNSSLQFKNNYILYYQYNMLFNNTNFHEIGIKIPLKLKK